MFVTEHIFPSRTFLQYTCCNIKQKQPENPFCWLYHKLIQPLVPHYCISLKWYPPVLLYSSNKLQQYCIFGCYLFILAARANVSSLTLPGNCDTRLFMGRVIPVVLSILKKKRKNSFISGMTSWSDEWHDFYLPLYAVWRIYWLMFGEVRVYILEGTWAGIPWFRGTGQLLLVRNDHSAPKRMPW